MEQYELAWAEALAAEHEHEHELLRTLHAELAEFAGECAAVLHALDTLVALPAVAGLLDTGTLTSRHAALGRDIARRLPDLGRNAPREDQLSRFYAHLGGDDDFSQPLVHQAGEYLRTDPRRGDHVLLEAIVDAAGERAVIVRVIGTATAAAVHAITPITHWTPAVVSLGKGEGERGRLVAGAVQDITAILEAPPASVSDDAAPFALPLGEIAVHAERTAHAIATGGLGAAIAKGHRWLEADLDALRAVHESTDDAPRTWHAARAAELAELDEEIRRQFEKVESVSRALGFVRPRIELAAQALASVENVRRRDDRLDTDAAATLDAARMALLLAAAEVLQASLPAWRRPARPERPVSRRWLVALGAVMLVAAGAAIALTLHNSHHAAAPDTILNVRPVLGPPPAPVVSAIEATSQPSQHATFYGITVDAKRQGKTIYAWHLAPPKGDPGCDKFGSVLGTPNRAVWHHAASDGCLHAAPQRAGTVTVTVTTLDWQCTASIAGSLTATGDVPRACTHL